MARSELLPSDLVTLKAYIIAQGDLSPLASGATTDYVALCDALNAPANPVVKAWKISAAPVDIDEASNWTSFDALSAGKRDSWRFFLDRSRDFTRAKIRSWVADVWGNATAGSAAEKILEAGTRNATRAEASGIGGTLKTTGTVSALDLVWEGSVNISHINQMAPFA